MPIPRKLQIVFAVLAAVLVSMFLLPDQSRPRQTESSKSVAQGQPIHVLVPTA